MGLSEAFGSPKAAARAIATHGFCIDCEEAGAVRDEDDFVQLSAEPSIDAGLVAREVSTAGNSGHAADP